MFVQKPGSTLQPSANQSSASSPAPHASAAPKKQKPTMPPTTLAGRCSARSHFERPRITWPARSSRPIVHDEVTTIFSTFDRTVLRARATSVPFVALEARAAASCPASCAASVAVLSVQCRQEFCRGILNLIYQEPSAIWEVGVQFTRPSG